VGAEHKWAVDDLSTVDKLDSKLKRIEVISVFDSKYMAKIDRKERATYESSLKIEPMKDSFGNLLQRRRLFDVLAFL
jgi:hypothetical protein